MTHATPMGPINDADGVAGREAPDPSGPASAVAGASWPADGCAEAELDVCRALETLTAAVNVLTVMPGHPASDSLVHDLQMLARTCRRRARAVQGMVLRDPTGAFEDSLLTQAELLAERAEHVAVWARTRVLGGDPGVLDQWLATQRPAAPGTAGSPGDAAVARRPAG